MSIEVDTLSGALLSILEGIKKGGEVWITSLNSHFRILGPQHKILG